MTDISRVHLIDKCYSEDIVDSDYRYHLFVRLRAKGRKFTNVDFHQSIFDTCYLRNCIFDGCDFTGCRFISTNFHGASFSGCKFDYSYFERTIIDNTILDTECPPFENLKMGFARTLRVNYQQLGDTTSANKAINVELMATESHLYKAWRSNESYYRKKYCGLKRLYSFLEWFRFKALDFIWGNGESALKLVRAGILIWILIALIDTIAFRNPLAIQDYWQAILSTLQIFFGTLVPPDYPKSYLAIIVCIRIVALGFFISILIKRLSRR